MFIIENFNIIRTNSDDQTELGVSFDSETESSCSCAFCSNSEPSDRRGIGSRLGDENLNGCKNADDAGITSPIASLKAVKVPTPAPTLPVSTIQGDTIWGTGLGEGVVLNYMFADSIDLDIKTHHHNTSATTDVWTDWQKEHFRAALKTISNVANIVFNETTDIQSADMIETVAGHETVAKLLQKNATGYHEGPSHSLKGIGAYSANPDAAVGIYDTSAWNPTNGKPGGHFFEVILHELGQGLGLGQPHDVLFGTSVMPGTGNSGPGIFDLNHSVTTMMSDNRGWTKKNIYTATPMALDIAALQAMYGAAPDTGQGNTLYELSKGSGPFIQAIWDVGGNDTIYGEVGSFQRYIIDLRPATLEYDLGAGGYVSYAPYSEATGGYTIANGVVIENAVGAKGPDYITGNSSNNILVGNGGNDVFCLDGVSMDGYGDKAKGTEGGHDIVYGGSGYDTLRLGHAASDYWYSGDSRNSITLSRAGNDIKIYDDVEYVIFSNNLYSHPFLGGFDPGYSSIESTGTAELITSSFWNNYIIKNTDSNWRVSIKDKDSTTVPVKNGLDDGWTIIQVETNANGGYNILRQHKDSHGEHWVLDDYGHTIAQYGLPNTEEGEKAIGLDINNDGVIGGYLAEHENDASEGNKVKLHKSSTDVYVVNDGNGPNIVKTASGTPASVSNNPWNLIHASSNKQGGYNIIWQHADGRTKLWETDKNANQKKEVIHKDIQGAEKAVRFDIDDSGSIGGFLETIENDTNEGNKVILGFSSTSGAYSVNSGNGAHFVKLMDGTILTKPFMDQHGWTVQHASTSYNGGYNFLAEHDRYKYLVHWELNNKGQAVKQDFYFDMEEAEKAIGYDINDDRYIGGEYRTAIENDADEGNKFKLYKAADTYDVYHKDHGAHTLRDVRSNPYFIDEKFLHVSSDGENGYNAIMMLSNGLIEHWKTDKNAQFKTLVSRSSNLQKAEKAVQFDIDDNGAIGGTLTAIENDADESNKVKLHKSTVDTYIVNDGNGPDVVKDKDGILVSVSEYSKTGWTIVHASTNKKGDGYNIVWELNGDPSKHFAGNLDYASTKIWALDANGQYTSQKLFRDIHHAESIVQFDIDDNGTIGGTLTAIENDADEGNKVKLYESSKDVYLVDDGNGLDVLKDFFHNIPVSLYRDKYGMEIVHVSSKDNGGYNIAWQLSDGYASLWYADADGEATRMEYGIDIQRVESKVKFDINDDGVIGGHLTPIENDEADGNTVKLYKSTTDVYLINNENSRADENEQAIVIVKTSDDRPMSVAEYAKQGMHAIHASEKLDGGYNFVMKQKEMYQHFQLEYTGVIESNTLYENIETVEVITGYDINDNGILGWG